MYPPTRKIFQFVFLALVSIMITVQNSFLFKTKFHVSDEDAPSKACNLAQSGEIPHHVTILIEGTYQCSGTLISEKYVLTLAECVERSVKDKTYKTKVKVVVGTRTIPGGTPCDVEKITYPSSYDRKSATDNIALIRLEEKVRLVNDVFPISLPDKRSTIKEGFELAVSGFRMMRAQDQNLDLRKFSMRVLSHEKCKKFYESESFWNLSGKFCAIAAFGHRSCLSDPGSPATNVDLDHVFGIHLDKKECFGKHPELFIDVTSYLEFIESAM